MNTATEYFDKTANMDETDRGVAAAGAGALIGGGVPGALIGYIGKRDKDKGKNNTAAWTAGGAGAVGGAGALIAHGRNKQSDARRARLKKGTAGSKLNLKRSKSDLKILDKLRKSTRRSPLKNGLKGAAIGAIGIGGSYAAGRFMAKDKDKKKD